MKAPSMGFLKNNAGYDCYHELSDVKNVIKYILRKNKNPDNDLIAYGGVGVIEFLGTENIIRQFHAVQQMYTRGKNFGRYIDHEIFSLSPEAEQCIQDRNLDIDAIARKMAYDF